MISQAYTLRTDGTQTRWSHEARATPSPALCSPGMGSGQVSHHAVNTHKWPYSLTLPSSNEWPFNPSFVIALLLVDYQTMQQFPESFHETP